MNLGIRDRDSRWRSVARALPALLLLAWAGSAYAAPTFGVRAGFNTGPDGVLVGGEMLAPVAPSWYFNPNLEYVDGDNYNLTSVSADFHYDFAVNSPGLFWLGAGPSLLFRDYSSPALNNDTAVGLNLLAGFGWRTRTGVTPYLQGKLVMSNNDDYGALGFGIRF